MVSVSKYGRIVTSDVESPQLLPLLLLLLLLSISHVPRPRVVHTRAGKIIGTPSIPAVTLTASGIGAGVGVGEDEMRPEAGSSLPASNSFLKVASLP